MNQQNSFTFSLNAEQQDQLVNLLKSGNFAPAEVPHTRIAVKGDKLSINLYNSGKCVVQGKGAADWITFTLEPLVLLEARIGYEQLQDPEAFEAHMGIDESGKGDFFGPLVIASAYVNPQIVEKLQAIKVRDSKTITSDKVALDMAKKISDVLGDRFSTVSIGSAAYNRMYSSMKNVNILLAWGHARAIENLLEKVPDCPRALSDKFGPDHRIEKALKEKGAKIKLDQRTKAESDPAVAAASILARAGFLRAMYRLGEKYEITMPKGASAKVRETAVELVKKHGPDVLLDVCKGHFKTADEVLKEAGFSRSDVPDLPASASKPFFRRKSAS